MTIFEIRKLSKTNKIIGSKLFTSIDYATKRLEVARKHHPTAKYRLVERYVNESVVEYQSINT